jgi:hypothetical protein
MAPGGSSVSARGTWPRKSLAERLYSRFEIDQATGCWLWTGGTNAEGYGIIIRNGDERLRVHRVSYEIHYSAAIPDGHDLDHVCHTRDPLCVGGPACRHRRCINPLHLEPVTRAENVRRGFARVPKTHCANNHEFTPANTRIRRGRRECITCARAHSRAAHQRRKARAVAA